MAARDHTNNFLDWFARIGITTVELAASRRTNGGPFLPGTAPVAIADIARHLRWLAAQNIPNSDRCGADIYIRPERAGVWPVVLLDDVRPALASELLAGHDGAKVETSTNNFQVWLHTSRSLSEPERLAVQRTFTSTHGTDRGSVSGEHFGRLPGFVNRKPEYAQQPPWVNFRGSSPAGTPPWPVPAELPTGPAGLFSPLGGRVQSDSDDSPDRHDESRAEFGFAVKALRAGRPLAWVRPGLTKHACARRGSDTHRYVERTLHAACRAAGVPYTTA